MERGDNPFTQANMHPLSDGQTDLQDSQTCRKRLENIVLSGEDCGDFHTEIQHLLAKLGDADFHDDRQLAMTLPSLLTLLRISKHTVLGNLRAVLAELISQEENLRLFSKSLAFLAETKGEAEKISGNVWRCLRTVLCVLWNCSDISPGLCKKLSDCDILRTCVLTLSEITRNPDFVAEDKKHFLVKAFLGILHNCVRNCPDCKEPALNYGCLRILPSLFTVPSPMVKAKSLIIVSHLVSEPESKMLHSSDDTIAFIVQVLNDSSKSKNHVSSKYGMSSLEVMKGLNNIAMNDENKAKIVAAGGLKLFAMLVLSDDKEEQEMAALGVWTLAFALENKGRIIQEPGLVEGLRNLTKGKDTASAHYARGALWEIFHGQEMVEKSLYDSSVQHVMISYQWDAQKVMSQVKDALSQSGYKVWMDVEHMTGSTLEAMALAVERAAVVLICMSDKYKASASCRTESEYIFRLRKDIVPLRVQSGYRPDGWLGILVGSRLYFDFSSEAHAQNNLPKLIRELGNRGVK
nr:hypothetical protein BaRGS_005473 [Batillaria attramentaria]